MLARAAPAAPPGADSVAGPAGEPGICQGDYRGALFRQEPWIGEL
ncbi:MAG: hypothetical protein ACXU8S_09160 [Phenylobacterium sp.]